MKIQQKYFFKDFENKILIYNQDFEEDIFNYFDIYKIETILSDNKKMLNFFIKNLEKYLNLNYNTTVSLFKNITHKDIIVKVALKLIKLKDEQKINYKDLKDILNSNIFTVDLLK